MCRNMYASWVTEYEVSSYGETMGCNPKNLGFGEKVISTKITRTRKDCSFCKNLLEYNSISEMGDLGWSLRLKLG